MQAAYENRGDIRRIVEQMVSTYHPAINGSEKKGKIYQELYGEIAVTKAE